MLRSDTIFLTWDFPSSFPRSTYFSSARSISSTSIYPSFQLHSIEILGANVKTTSLEVARVTNGILQYIYIYVWIDTSSRRKLYIIKHGFFSFFPSYEFPSSWKSKVDIFQIIIIEKCVCCLWFFFFIIVSYGRNEEIAVRAPLKF